MSEWISVKDRLPEQFDYVLIRDKNVSTCAWFQDIEFIGKGIDIIPTHWMPFPYLQLQRRNNGKTQDKTC